MKKRKCRACKRQYVVGTTVNGREIPVDPEPHEKGTVRLFGDGRVEIVPPADRKAYHQAGVPLHPTHFVFCVEAEEHRDRSRKQQVGKGFLNPKHPGRDANGRFVASNKAAKGRKTGKREK